MRTVWIHNVSPTSLYNYEICVLKYDESIIGDFNTTEELQEYEAAGEENEECSIIEFRNMKRPNNHWNAPFVTGHTYYIRWEYGLDFERMDV